MNEQKTIQEEGCEENFPEFSQQKQRLIDKDAMLRDLASCKEKVEIISANICKGGEDEAGRRYCQFICQILDVVSQTVDRQEEVKELW